MRKSRDHTLVTFLYGGVGHADEIERDTRFSGRLNSDYKGVDPLHGGSIGLDEHWERG